jgi:hypothetical protein
MNAEQQAGQDEFTDKKHGCSDRDIGRNHDLHGK